MVLNSKTMKSIIIVLMSIFLSVQIANSQSNILQLGIGIAGSDGVDEQPIYDITFKRKLSKYFYATIQYAPLDVEQQYIGANRSTFAGVKFIGVQNEAEKPITDLRLSSSVYLGLEIGIVRTTMSTLYLIGGSRYQNISHSMVISSGSEEEFFEVNLYDLSLIHI